LHKRVKRLNAIDDGFLPPAAFTSELKMEKKQCPA